ncbi:MAG TPA: response regulator [Anaerolineae bacterium]|nr:response regulator [Anaerolineae bacterium]HQK15080.1 response regulator [Anaerolineae bacterium]
MGSSWRKTILVVDDATENLEILDGILRPHYRVQVARNGEMALRVATSTNRPDLILLDIVMPGMDGYEVCRRLKANEYTREIPVLFISALDSVFDKVQGFDAGAVDFITRPFQAEEILARVHVHLQVRSLQQQLAARNEQLRQALAREQARLAEHIEAGLRAGNFAWWEIEFPSGRILFDTLKAKMLGYAPEQFKTYEDFTQLLHPDDYEKTMQAMRDYLEGRAEKYEVEYRLQTCYGTYKWFRDVGAETEKPETPDKRRRIIGIVEDITRRKQAEEALHRHIERLRIIHAIDGATLAGGTPEHLATTALRFIQTLVPYRCGVVVTFDLENTEATLLAIRAAGEVHVQPGLRFAQQDTPALQTLRMGQIYTEDDLVNASLPPHWQAALRAMKVQAGFAVPLLAEGKLIGALALGSESPHTFAPESIDIAREVADQVAVGIQQARLREQIQRYTATLEQQVAERTAALARRNLQLHVAAEIARDATTAHSRDELLNRAVNLICERFGFYHVGIFLLDAQGKYAVLHAATGEPGRQLLATGFRLEIDKNSIVNQVIINGQARIVPDVGADSDYYSSPVLPETRAEMTLPMRAGGRIIGALDVQSAQLNAFDDEDSETLQILADQLAVALENIRLFEQMQATLEARLQMLIANLPVILFAVDSDGICTLLEGKGLAALSLDAGAAPGKPLGDVFPGAPELTAYMQQALQGERLSVTLHLNDRAFEAWYEPLRDADGVIRGVTGVCIDVTERQTLEAQMHRQERLAAIGQLAGGIAHDFNNMLSTIIMYAALIQRVKRLPAEALPLSQIIIDESHRAARLIRQILDFSRRSPMAVEPVDLRAFIQETIEILQKTLPENITLSLEIAPGEYVVNADPTRIQQVVMNLAVNARDAMPEGGTLRVSLTRVQAVHPDGLAEQNLEAATTPPLTAGEWVRLTVADTGIGMTEDVRAHLFEPFFTTKGPKGTGLGLAQVYGIVKQHGGEIEVTTEPGRGTTVAVDLPLYRETPTPEQPEAPAAPFAPEGHGETLLLVEDEENVRRAALQGLETLGYRVIAAADGETALSLYEEANAGKDIALVITDLVMPGMNGRELLQRLRRINPQLRAVALTGHVLQEEAEVLRREGLAELVYKPLDLTMLAAVVRRALAQKE